MLPRARSTVSIHSCVQAIVRVQVHVDRIDVILDQDRVCGCLDDGTRTNELIDKPQAEGTLQTTTLCIPARLSRAGKEVRIVVGDGLETTTPDTGLVRLLVRANAIRARLFADRSRTFQHIAKAAGV